MTLRISAPAGFTLAALLLCFACGGEAGADDAGPPGAIDSGSTPDAGAPLDAGMLDAGPGMDAGPTSDAGPGIDASPDWPDAGLPSPEWVDLDVGPAGSCPGFTPCGGDIVGVWDLGGGCFELDLEPTIERCPGAQVTRREGRGRGRVIFGPSGFAHRVAESVVDADTFFPAVCTQFFSCAMLEDAMRPYVTEVSCVEESSGDCNCASRLITQIDQRDAYSTDGNEIVGNSSGKRWEYCVAGDRLDYRDTSPAGAREPGDIQLDRASSP